MGSPSIFDLYVRGLRISRRIPQDSYLSNLPAVRCLQEPNELALTKRVAFLVGENGVGKSTLMEALAIAMGFNPKAVRSISVFPPLIPTLNYTGI